ncbi:MAG: dephospho-CoA kinase [Pseudomonadota bacterium]|jgi:dephospho-CoA kinase
MMAYCVGVTGGIGSGKSSAAALFAERGAGIVDTDDIAHELTRSGGRAMAAIIKAFGPGIAAADGSLDRNAMRQRVFADPVQRKVLEGILHPLIRAEARDRVNCSAAPYVMLVVPLLLESSGYPDLVQRVLVIDCEESLQISRTMQRSALTEEAVRAIMAAQLPRQQRLARADDVLLNNGDLSQLRSQVDRLHDRYLALAAAPRNPS